MTDFRKIPSFFVLDDNKKAGVVRQHIRFKEEEKWKQFGLHCTARYSITSRDIQKIEEHEDRYIPSLFTN